MTENTKSAVNQKQGVYDAIVAFCDENEVNFEDGMLFKPSKEQRATIVAMVTAALWAGEIELKSEPRKKYDTEAKMKGYANGLVTNWLRKDKRLNGNVDPVIKNPGSRAGSGDNIVKELRKLKKTLTEAGDIEKVDAKITKRLASIQAEKAKAVEIDVDLLPEELRHLAANAE